LPFQIVQEAHTYCGRSFEDAFILANPTKFGIVGSTDAELATAAFREAKGIGKTNFALKFALEDTNWTLPSYLKESLVWLSQNPNEAVADLIEDMSEIREAIHGGGHE